MHGAAPPGRFCRTPTQARQRAAAVMQRLCMCLQMGGGAISALDKSYSRVVHVCCCAAGHTHRTCTASYEGRALMGGPRY